MKDNNINSLKIWWNYTNTSKHYTTGTSEIFSKTYDNAVEAIEERLYNVNYWIKKCILD